MIASGIRPDLGIISEIIEPNSNVLDVGCGDGALLSLLQDQRGVRASGIELSQEGVNECVRKGLSVVQGDADSDLDSYISGVFDTVILSHTILAVRDPKYVLEKLTSIGRQVIVSIYNFAYYRDRLNFFFSGRLPESGPELVPWGKSQVLRRCSIKDFEDLCTILDLNIERLIVLGGDGRPLKAKGLRNLFGRQAVFVLSRK